MQREAGEEIWPARSWEDVVTSSGLQIPLSGHRVSGVPLLSLSSSLKTSSFYFKVNGHD